jgi:tight adherence protein C
MLEKIVYFLHPQQIIAILVAVSVFATVLTIAAPFLSGDRLRTRMKSVTTERERLKAQSRAFLAQSEARLRDKPQAGGLNALVEKLNLRKLFEAESARTLLRQAGYRSERNLIVYLVCRLAAPAALGILVFIYSAVAFGDSISANMRFAATFVGGVAGFYMPNVLLKNSVRRRQLSIKRAWSDALDLLLICVESGMSIELAIQRVAKEIGTASVPLAEELTLTNAELSFLQDRRKAFENLGKRTGIPIVKSVVTSLIQSERYGTPLGTALRVLAQENRDMRMSDAEKKAAALPPKLTVPMVLFFLPVIFVVILGPSIILVLGLQ